MSESDPSKIDIFGKTYEADSSFRITHQVSVAQAEELERQYPECLSIQEAMRAAARDGLDRREETLSVAEKIEQLQLEVATGFESVEQLLLEMSRDQESR